MSGLHSWSRSAEGQETTVPRGNDRGLKDAGKAGGRIAHAKIVGWEGSKVLRASSHHKPVMSPTMYETRYQTRAEAGCACSGAQGRNGLFLLTTFAVFLRSPLSIKLPAAGS